MDIFAKCYAENDYLTQLKKQVDLKRLHTPLTGTVGPHMYYADKEVITWCFNDYLGMASHPSNRELEKMTIADTPANHPMGSRMLSGNNTAYQQLENTLSSHLQKEDSMIFATGYLAAIGVIPALCKRNDYIIIDTEAHACLLDAAKIALANGAKLRVFKHNDADSLEQQLKLARRDENCGILIVCDGVYSMSGDLADLPKIIALKKQYNAKLFLDDAHGIGAVGELGRGTAAHFNLYKDVDLIMTVLSKSLASIGGGVSGDAAIINYLRYTARTNIFSHNLQLVFVLKALNSLQLMYADPSLLERLNRNVVLLRDGLRKLELNIGNTQSPIIPLIFNVTNPLIQINKLMTIVFALREEFNIFVSPVTFPAVASNQFLLRFTVTAGHSVEDIEITLAALKQLKERGLFDW